MTIVELHMNIDCAGCEENVRKALMKLEGVHYVTVDRLHGKVTVTGSTNEKKVLRAARRTGKLAVLWPSAYDNPAYLQLAHAHPAAHHYYHHAAAQTQHQHRHYDGTARKNGGVVVSAVGRRPAAQSYHKASSYNYHVHGYLDSDLYGGYHGQHPDVVPAGVQSYFSDDNPNACSIM